MTDEELGFGSVAPHFQEEVAPKKEVEKKPTSEVKPVAPSKAISDRMIGFKTEDIKPDWATNAVKESIEKAPVVAAEPAPVTESKAFQADLKNIGIGSAATLALLGIGAGGMHMYSKLKGGNNTTIPSTPTPANPASNTPATQINTPATQTNTPVEPSNELPKEVLESPGYKEFTELEKKSGGPITNAEDLKLIQQSERNRIAKEAGVTPTTSAPEAQTLVTTHEAALDPVEKAQEKVTYAEPSKEVKGAVIPKSAKKIKEIPEGMSILEGAAGPTNWMYNTHKGRYNAIINEFNQGQHPKTMEEAYALDKMFRAKYGGMNKGPNIPQEIGIERGIPAPEPGGRLGNVVSHAGKLGILASIADIANAAQSQKKGDVLSTLYDIAQNLSVPTGLGLHTGGLNSNEERELAQRRHIGGGRGVAPAGMGQR